MADNNFLAQLLALNDAAQVRDTYLKSPFGYPGGKTRSLKNLLSILPYRKIWMDVCAGSGAATLARHESELEVFNDRCAGITSFFRAVRQRDTCAKLIERLQMTVCSREDFIWARDSWECDWHDDVERAARWYYCVQHSFNSKGWSFGRVTSGRSQCGKIFNNLNLFWPIQHRMQRVYVENQDFRTLFKDFNTEKNGDEIVWYIDPPYWQTIGIYKHELKPEEHFEIGERAMHLNGFIALSGYDHERHPYNTFKWDKKESWEVDVSMTGMSFTDTNHLQPYEEIIQRGKVRECVWIRDTAR
jgi:DNA adenine methylase